MPSILFLNKAPPYRDSGAERVIYDLGKHLAAHDWDVHYLTPGGDDLVGDDGPPEIEGITFHTVSTPDSFFAGKAAFFLAGVPAYRRLVADLDPDLIYDNASPFPFVYAYLSAPDRLVTKVHAIYGRSALRNKDHPITKLGTPVGEQLYRLRDGGQLLTVSESTKSRLSGLVRSSPDDITVVPNGIPVEDFDPQFSPDGPVLALCELTPRKNVAALLKAWRRLEASGHADRGLIVAGDGPARERLESLAAELSLSTVEFRGYVSETEKRRLYRDAFCYVLPTRMEGFGLTNLEAMASCCVVVSTDAHGVREYLVDGENGRSVPVDDVDALVAVLRDVLSDPAQAEPLATAGVDTAAKYRLEETLERERQILAGLVE